MRSKRGAGAAAGGATGRWPRLARAALAAVFASAILVAGAAAHAFERYDLEVSRDEARETLGWMLELGEADPGASPRDSELARLMNSYRPGPGALTLRDAPYLRMILADRIPGIYRQAYESAHESKLKETLNSIPLEAIFDGFLQAIVDDTLPPSIEKAGKKIGKCLARKALKAKSPTCVLDASDKLHKRDFFDLAGIKLDCEIGTRTTSSCRTRRILFDAAKEELIEARTSPEVRETVTRKFEEVFPGEFRKGFLAQLNDTERGSLEQVARKLGVEAGPYWEAGVPMIPTDLPGRVRFRDFARDLRLDLALAARLRSGLGREESSAGAALFYGGANRLLLLTGGKALARDRGGLVLADPAEAQVDPRDPTRAPRFRVDPFGGWGAERSGPGGTAAYSAWDWRAYDPLRPNAPSPLRLFPAEFRLSALGGAQAADGPEPIEKLGDLARLIDAMVEFLEVTRPGGAYGAHFGTEAELAGIADPANPILFPKEGRKLAVGAIGAALRNLIASPGGHLERKDASDPAFGLGASFHEEVTLRGRREGGSVDSVAEILLSLHRLRSRLQRDPSLAPELGDLLPAFDQAIEFGALYLGAQGQDGDGAFHPRLGGPASSGATRRLEDTILGLRVLGRAFQQGGRGALRVRLVQGWRYLEAIWGDRLVPPPAGLPPHLGWALLTLWAETQGEIRTSLGADLDWSRWERRFMRLRVALDGQLRSSKGPQFLVED